MKKFMVFIQPIGDSIFNLPEENQKEHVQKVGAYIKKLRENGSLLDAQPLQPFGSILIGKGGKFSEETLEELKIAGYYVLQAHDKESLTRILKEDPRFDDSSWKLEIREILELM